MWTGVGLSGLLGATKRWMLSLAERPSLGALPFTPFVVPLAVAMVSTYLPLGGGDGCAREGEIEMEQQIEVMGRGGLLVEKDV